MRLYKYVQSHIIILQHHVSATSVAIIRVAYNQNKINMQIIVQKCIRNLLEVIASTVHCFFCLPGCESTMQDNNKITTPYFAVIGG